MLYVHHLVARLLVGRDKIGGVYIPPVAIVSHVGVLECTPRLAVSTAVGDSSVALDDGVELAFKRAFAFAPARRIISLRNVAVCRGRCA